MLTRRFLPLIVLLFLIGLANWLRNRNDRPLDDQTVVEQEGSKSRGLNRFAAKLDYTRHALCRMDCRKITKGEVEDILRNGKINYRKSDLKDKPCPTYAVEGYTLKDNQHVRIVFAQCENHIKVVTCIDLENEFECHCQ